MKKEIILSNESITKQSKELIKSFQNTIDKQHETNAAKKAELLQLFETVIEKIIVLEKEVSVLKKEVAALKKK
ncbi:MAG: hypothetical protein WCK02_07595 [Bacteroidota bacterium]